MKSRYLWLFEVIFLFENLVECDFLSTYISVSINLRIMASCCWVCLSSRLSIGGNSEELISPENNFCRNNARLFYTIPEPIANPTIADRLSWVFVTVLLSHYLLTGHFVGRRKQQQLQNWLKETVVEWLKVYVMWRETPIRSSVLISLYNSNCCQPADVLLTSL